MKGLIITIGFVLSFIASFAQTPINGSSSAVTVLNARTKNTLNFYLPVASDTTLNGGLDSLGALLLVIKPGDTSLYLRTPRPGGNKWTKMLKSGDAAGGVLSFNTRTGTVTLTSLDVTTALGFTPPNPNGTNLQYIAGDGSKVTFPTIPAQFNPIAGHDILVTGTYPNKTFTVDTATMFPELRATIPSSNPGITSLNGLTGVTQTFSVGTTGTNFNISSSGTNHAFNIPVTSSSNTGLVSPSLYNTWQAKLSNITALISAGTNVSISGSGTSGSPYVISSTGGGSSGWSITGNSGTSSSTNFIGTIDNVPLSFRVNNVASGYIGNATTFNTFFGSTVGATVTTSQGNTAMGWGAASSLTTGGNNTAIGTFSLGSTDAGIFNTAIGIGSLNANTAGSNNTAVGGDALQNTSGSHNTSLGYAAMLGVTTGHHNIGIGSDSAGNSALTTGSYNTLIGLNNPGITPTLNNSVLIATGKGTERLRFDSAGNLKITHQTLSNDTTGNKILVQDASGNVHTSSWLGGGGGSTDTSYLSKRIDWKQRVYNVIFYGADSTGSVDATVAIQAAINDCMAHGGGIVYFPNGHYKISGALQTSISGQNPNSQLYVPPVDFVVGGKYPNLKLLGESAPVYDESVLAFTDVPSKGVILESTITGSGTFPAVIGCKGNSTAYNFSFSDFEVENITILTKNSTSGPTMCGIKGDYFINTSYKDVRVDVDTPLVYSVIPTNNVFGISGVQTNGGTVNRFDNVIVSGYNYGIVFGEHAQGSVQAFACNHALCPTIATHSSHFDVVKVNWCKEGIYTAFGGVAGVGVHPLNIDNFNLEIDTISSVWWKLRYVVNDSLHNLMGNCTYAMKLRGGSNLGSFPVNDPIFFSSRNIRDNEKLIGSNVGGQAFTIVSNDLANGHIYIGNTHKSFYDENTEKWGIGTASFIPAYPVHIQVPSGPSSGLLVENKGSANFGELAAMNDLGDKMQVFMAGSSYAGASVWPARSTVIAAPAIGGLVLSSYGSGPLDLTTGGLSSGNLRMRINSNGNLLYNTTSANGALLNLNGGIWQNKDSLAISSASSVMSLGIDTISGKYVRFTGGGGGGTSTGVNGLNGTTNIGLGGTLSTPTVITLDATNSLTFQGATSNNGVIDIKAPTAGNYAGINFRNDGGLNGQFVLAGSAFSSGPFTSNSLSLASYAGNLNLLGYGSGLDVIIGTGASGTERMRVKSNGFVGINTSTRANTEFLRVNGGVQLDLGGDATGDTYYRESTGAMTRLPIGSADNVLTVSGGKPAWLASSNISNLDLTITGDRVLNAGTHIFNINATGGGKLRFTLGSDAVGDMFYRDASGFMARLPIGGAQQHLLGGTIPHWGDTTTGTGGSDTLKLVNEGTGLNLGFTSVDTLKLSTILAVNSISGAKDTDSTLRLKLVNDSSLGSAAAMYYGTGIGGSAGRLGYYQGPTTGTYTPTLTNTTNLTSSSAGNIVYTRIGNTVHVTIGGTMTPTTANAAVVLTISLPFTTATTTQSGIGSGTLQENAGGRAHAGIIVNVVSATTVTATLWNTINATGNYSLSFDYTL